MPPKLHCGVRTIPESNSDHQAIATRYRRFAEVEARANSRLYAELANGIAGSTNMLAFLNFTPC